MIAKPKDAIKYRQRSNVNEGDYPRILREFCQRIVRMKTTSEPYQEGREQPPQGQLVVKFLVNGNFGCADDLINALRVAGGYYLPRK